MRTTITIDDGLLEDAKRRAEELDITLSAMIESALRECLAKSPSVERPPFRLVTFGADGLRPEQSWEALGRLVDEDEDERLASLPR